MHFTALPCSGDEEGTPSSAQWEGAQCSETIRLDRFSAEILVKKNEQKRGNKIILNSEKKKN